MNPFNEPQQTLSEVEMDDIEWVMPSPRPSGQEVARRLGLTYIIDGDVHRTEGPAHAIRQFQMEVFGFIVD